MPRVTWSRLTVLAVVAIGALGLASCFHDVGDCPTCPGLISSSIEIQVPQFGLLDSVHVSVDGSDEVTVKRNRTYTFRDLTAGTHEVTLVRWISTDNGASRTSTLFIQLDRGEKRFIIFHNDFPLVAWAPSADPGWRAPLAPRMG